VPVNLSAGRALGCMGNLPFHTIFTALDFWWWWTRQIPTRGLAIPWTISRLSFFSNRSLHQPRSLVNRLKTEFTFRHLGGWWLRSTGLTARMLDRS
jgi:hypothetical protein